MLVFTIIIDRLLIDTSPLRSSGGIDEHLKKGSVAILAQSIQRPFPKKLSCVAHDDLALLSSCFRTWPTWQSRRPLSIQVTRTSVRRLTSFRQPNSTNGPGNGPGGIAQCANNLPIQHTYKERTMGGNFGMPNRSRTLQHDFLNLLLVHQPFRRGHLCHKPPSQDQARPQCHRAWQGWMMATC